MNGISLGLKLAMHILECKLTIGNLLSNNVYHHACSPFINLLKRLFIFMHVDSCSLFLLTKRNVES